MNSLTRFLLNSAVRLGTLEGANTVTAEPRRFKSGQVSIPKNNILPVEWGPGDLPNAVTGVRNSTGIFAFGGSTMNTTTLLHPRRTALPSPSQDQEKSQLREQQQPFHVARQVGNGATPPGPCFGLSKPAERRFLLALPPYPNQPGAQPVPVASGRKGGSV